MILSTFLHVNFHFGVGKQNKILTSCGLGLQEITYQVIWL